MSKSHILILTVMISLVTLNIIQAGVIREQNIPELDIARIVGKWYRLTSDSTMAEFDGLTCIIYDIQQESDNAFTMTKIETLTPETKEILPDVPDRHTEVVNLNINRNNNIITMSMGFGEMKMVIFDVEYDSYMAMYLAADKDSIANGASGDISIFSRQKTLPESVIDKITNSNFYQQGVNNGQKASLRISNVTGCP